uniref:Uncharacterized protein n=1 Tax=Lactuca sativa TaxID=4236 RepID=A0A9R1V000_LACSA|nr:hypothetical protein LSAT_V11C700377470 [Lactuca sativa]
MFIMLHCLEGVSTPIEDEEPDEADLKRRKAHEAEINEHAHIIREAEEKERAEKEPQATLKNLPLTPKAFRFRAFIKVASVPFSDSIGDQMMFNFYLKHMKPQFETWSVSKIVAVKVTGPIETESFFNAKFKVARGSARQACEFTLADLPSLLENSPLMTRKQ